MLIEERRVRINGVAERDPERRVDLNRDRIAVDGAVVRAEARVYLALNKPRGLVTTASDEQGRRTVLECLSTPDTADTTMSHQTSGDSAPSRRAGALRSDGLPRVFPVGRLDKASEGLLLLTNDTAWAARITDPATHLDKVYHVQVDGLADETFIGRMHAGVVVEGDFLAAKHVTVLRRGQTNNWLEVVLDEGKNRHIRRLAGALGLNVLRLVRVAIGPVQLGALAKGEWRHLKPTEKDALAGIEAGHFPGSIGVQVRPRRG